MIWFTQLPIASHHNILEKLTGQSLVIKADGFEHLCSFWTKPIIPRKKPKIHTSDEVDSISKPLLFNVEDCQVLQDLYPRASISKSNFAVSDELGLYKEQQVAKDFILWFKQLNHLFIETGFRNKLECLINFSNINADEGFCYSAQGKFFDTIREKLGKPLSSDQQTALEHTFEKLTSMDLLLLLFLLILTIILFPLLIFTKILIWLGVAPREIFREVIQKITKTDGVSEKLGTRLLFENHFSLITNLLGKHRLVLFIDDLDRCDRDYTRQVLEVTNFLSSSGALFIVIGMAPRYVLANVTLSFQDTAKAVHEADIRNGKNPPGHDPNAGQSWFAQHYLQKLINIEVPVPKPDAGQVKALLKNEAQSQEQDEDRKLEQLEKSEKRIDDALKFFGKLFRIALSLGVIGYAIYFAEWGLDGKTIPPSVKEQMESPATVSPKETEKAGQAQNQPKGKSPDTKNETGGTEEKIFIPAPSRDESFVAWPLWVGISTVVFVVLLGAVAYLLIRKQDALNDQRWWWLKPLLKRLKVTLFGPEVTQDTKDFTDALDIWYELIARKDPTPRNIKAFKNHLRYLASRDNQTPENSREAHLVALATLFYVYPKDFLEGILKVMEVYFSDEISPSTERFEEECPDLIMTLGAHKRVFGRIPSAEDIRFFNSMTQDMQIHRPD